MVTVSAYLVLAFVGMTLAFSGQYVPKSFYVIDPEGHRLDTVYIRSRRDLLPRPLLRFRRGVGGGGGASASSHASASSGASSGAGGQDYSNFGGFDPGLVFPDFSNFAQSFPAAFSGGGGSGSGKGGAQSFASSSSSSSSGTGNGGGGGYANQGHAGGLGAGHGVEHTGPVLFSRFGEDKGTGVKVDGAAQGPQGAFSASSSSIDSDGNIKYSVQSGKH